MTAISVIVPVYKVEKYLSRCIDSILEQTFKDFELILVDDGSPDNCGAICDEYALKDRRICVIHQKNAGVSDARNAGINIAKGEWLAFVDSDDWIHKDYLKILFSGTLKDTDVVFCDRLVTYNDTEVDADYSKASFKSVSLKEIQANRVARTYAWGKLYRRTSVADLRYISGAVRAQDVYFNDFFFDRNMKFRITDAKLYYYCMRPDSAIHNNQARGILNSIWLILENLERIDDSEKRKRVIQRCYKHVLSMRYRELYTDDYPEVLKTSKQLFKRLSEYLPELDMKDRLVMHVLSASPFLYRAWIIHNDHSLLEIERSKKQAMKSVAPSKCD